MVNMRAAFARRTAARAPGAPSEEGLVASGLNVTSEIGPLKKVMLHRPGEELLNLPPRDLARLLFDDVPFLPEAQREHDAFADALRAEGVEVVYLEDLVAEALDAVPGAREEFVSQWICEAGIKGDIATRAVREFLDGIADTRALVKQTMAGIARSAVELPLGSTATLNALVEAESQSHLLADPMPNLYFCRDPFAVVGDGVLLNRMYAPVRNRETIYGKYLFKYHPTYRTAALYYRRAASFHIEGGDVLVLSRDTIAVGISERTEAAAIDVLAQSVFWDTDCPVERILAFNIPVSRAFMHLDTVFTQVDVDAFTIHPAIVGALEVFELTPGTAPGEVRIREEVDTLEHLLARALGLDAVRLIPCGGGDAIAADREQWSDGSNTLAVAPGRIVVYDRNVATNDALARAGMELQVVPSAELSRGRGGPRCMSMPFARGPVAGA